MIGLAKKILTGLSIVWLVVAFSGYAAAAALSFAPSESTIGAGDQIGIDVIVSGLENVDLGAFDFAVSYDDTVLSFGSYVLGEGLGDIGAGDAEDWSFGDLGGGVINLAEISWLDDLSFQLDSFTLATLTFVGTDPGISPLSFSDVCLGDNSGDSIDAALETGSVNVVPVPAAIWLFGSGLIGLAGLRRKLTG